ncbi:sugar transferase [Ruminococcus sp. 5_1_39BFAA]|uniref:sugar transferase n=1 Tax=Ruminococcus sp. 5_1_39BFAA TaxID=457412 RepID=UPI003564EAC2
MYRKSPQGWLKHWDFILLDFVCLQMALLGAYLIRIEKEIPIFNESYWKQAFIFFLCQALIIFFMDPFRGILGRGLYTELISTVRHCAIVMLTALFYLYMTKEIADYSRIYFLLTGILYSVFDYLLRIWRKSWLHRRNGESSKESSMIVLTTKELAAQTLEDIYDEKYQRFSINGIAVMNENLTGQSIHGVPVIADENSIVEYICREWVDEVFIRLPQGFSTPERILQALANMGVTIHLDLSKETGLDWKDKYIESIGNCMVLTTSVNMVNPKQMLYKRTMDIFGGLAGCLLTGIMFLFVAPAIYIKSPGPIFFSQIRIGKGGRKFKMYKFRSMYMDAEKRKQELMSQNKMKEGFMFKMDNDPRIIGSEKKGKDGKPKGIGNFIRKTSIDEFPQFWNVLKGDMSLVGTRPPTVDEWEKYDFHHRARMAIKPGVTGMWQVSGRSDIVDFEEVVRLDTDYIKNWSIGLDCKILLKTVLKVLRSEGAE